MIEIEVYRILTKGLEHLDAPSFFSCLVYENRHADCIFSFKW